ncbi:fimbria/pilus outer membrane usher protein [Serratia marcescens]|uniref:fimbria/pilus outer membrane usher protein n=1 Tax=Serratia marcescens TaxID=615 RepID=UPI0007450390|nr:fimbrial biogenesis outer membrane usher protein [Serratia marcescens]NCI54096.1 fimbrial biogenesis outer membrane usher protein [Serratia marcescens]NDJ06080.1 fimbrial biogenesis outer membrane usher protein [Serratia marcescens]NDJ29285.1 fimbrial biogenesis outer membrane usher protein [Serratia marcescens]NDJ43381.1 fimbrial biogenesis outer membrane usher protein [Serratia marcescens]
MEKQHRNRITRPAAAGIERSQRTRLAVMMPSLLALGFAASTVQARDYFNPAALELGNSAASALELEQFSVRGGQLPGVYRVDIYLNGNQIETRDVTFVEVAGKLRPELTPTQLDAMGVKVDAFPALQQLPPELPLNDLGHYIPDADSQFDFSQQRLNLSIPQAALTSEARGYVDPAQWDQGMPAALLNYTFSGANTQRHKGAGAEDNYYLNLRSGLNLGAWRLRNYSTYNEGNGQRHWDNVNTYLQRDIQSLKGQLTLGDSATPGDVFGSVQFRGAQLASDDNMYPDSLRGFAPVVRGIAQSNAQVTVRQNGYIIYQTYVSPGAFAITDLYPTASSGDLEVTITEASGAERHFVQPFAAVPVMLREGRMKYAFTAGEFRSGTDAALTPTFGQGTLIYGLPHDSTAYGGLLLADRYNAQVLGVGHGFGVWGSLSMDITQAKTELRDGSRHSGQSYRFQYAKDVEATNTTFTLAGYRYSTRGFYDFQEANELGGYNENDWRQNYNKRSRAQININQAFREYGSLSLSAYQQDYWGEGGYERSLSAGYNLSYDGIAYGLNYTYSQTPGNNPNDQQVAFNVQVPLSKWLPNSWASYSLNSSKRGSTAQQVGLNGTALADNNLSYSLQQSYGSRGDGASGSLGANYKGTYGEMQAGYSYTRDSRQINYGLQGGIVAHPYGVTFSQQQGDTLALVRAPGAAGAKVQNNTGVRTDWRGYAVVPYVGTYRKNRIALDTETLGSDVDIDTNTQTVIPTQGALVLADFQTRVGNRVLMTLSYQGKPVPFGAIAALQQEAGALENSGIVGPDGQLYLSGVPEQGQLQVKWGNAASQQCRVAFTLPSAEAAAGVLPVTAVCR